MADEIEKKYRLTESQVKFVLNALEEIGAQFAGEDFEENILLLGGDLLERQAVLRLRRIGGKTILTYKQRLETRSAVKHYIEYETEVADFSETASIFESLGYRQSVVYEKRRRKWNFRQVEIVLDELPFGLYLEIEGSLTAIREAEIFLDIEDFEVEQETYPRLTAQYGKRRGDLIEARFS